MVCIAYFVLSLLYFMFGACVFSFLAVVADRLPKGISPFKGRSFCTACNHTLSASQLIPCFSYILLRGKCKYCRSEIPLRCPVSEFLGGASTLACFMKFGGVGGRSVFSFAVICVLAVIAFMDLDTMEIWDRFILILCALSLVAIPLFPNISIVERLIGMLSVSLPMLLIALAVPGGFGGGDIKLMFAAGFLLGWKAAIVAAFIGILSGGAFGALLLIIEKAKKSDRFAFGPHLCLGIAAAMLWGDAVMAWYIGIL